MRRWAIFGAFTLAGCSLFTDLSGFTQQEGVSTGDGGGSSSGSTTIPSTGNDGGGDGSASSSSSGGGSDVDVPPLPRPCAGSHVFCTDFDKGDLPGDWDTAAGNAGTLSFDTNLAVSAPRSLRVTHPKGQPGGTPLAVKTVAVEGSKGLHCSFAYRRAIVDPAGVLVVLMLNFDTGTKEHFFAEIKDGLSEGRVYLAATDPAGVETSDFPTVPTVGGAIDQWVTVDWVLDLAQKRSIVKRDTTVVDDRVFTTIDGMHVKNIKFSLGLGDFIAPTGEWAVHFDDFVCDAL